MTGFIVELGVFVCKKYNLFKKGL